MTILDAERLMVKKYAAYSLGFASTNSSDSRLGIPRWSGAAEG